MNIETLNENYIDHEVRIRMQEHLNKQMNRKLNVIMTICGSFFLTVLIPIILHSLKLV
jgi:hypothetical protein